MNLYNNLVNNITKIIYKNINENYFKINNIHNNDSVMQSHQKELDKINAPYIAYNTYLKELNKAKNDINNSNPSYHYGYKNVLISAGWDASGGDSYTNFKLPNSVFEFFACSWNNWKISPKVVIKTNNKEYKINATTKESFIHDWIKYNLTLDDLIPIEQKKHEYKSYIVRESDFSNSKHYVFSTFEEAKEYAYKWAEKEILNGKKHRDITSKYFNNIPIDKTKYNQPYLIYYEYYLYDESSYGIIVDGIEK